MTRIQQLTTHTVALLLAGAVATFALGIAAVHADSENGKDNPRALGSTLEIHVSDNGKVLVRGAKVSAVSGTTVSATTVFGSTSVSWTIDTDASTHFVKRAGGPGALSDVKVGDFVSFSGSLNQSVSSLTVNAQVVKDFSVPAPSAFQIKGTVESISTTTNSIVVATSNGTTTLQLASGATIKLGGGVITLGDVNVGDKIQASGSFNATTNVFTADKVTIGGRPEANNEHATSTVGSFLKLFFNFGRKSN